MLSSMIAGGIDIILGFVCVGYGLHGTPLNHAPVRLWRVALTLVGMGMLSLGSLIALGYAAVYADTVVPAKNAPLPGWVIWILSDIGIVGGCVAALIVLLMATRQRLLTQREPPHNA